MNLTNIVPQRNVPEGSLTPSDLDSNTEGIILVHTDGDPSGYIICNDAGEWYYCTDLDFTTATVEGSLNDLLNFIIDENEFYKVTFKFLDFNK